MRCQLRRPRYRTFPLTSCLMLLIKRFMGHLSTGMSLTVCVGWRVNQLAASLETLESEGPFEPAFMADMAIVFDE